VEIVLWVILPVCLPKSVAGKDQTRESVMPTIAVMIWTAQKTNDLSGQIDEDEGKCCLKDSDCSSTDR
jgi:hypothetical protein